MKCPTCDGTGEIGNYEHDEDFRICPTCRGEGSIFDLSDPQPWDIDNPGWGRFDGPLQSQWKTRFVVSGCNKPSKIVEFMYQKTGIEYASLQFSESKIFPGENETYMIPCMYFFPAHERDFTANVTKAELTELYWY